MVSSGVRANGLKPESEGTFNSEVKLFLARKKKKKSSSLEKEPSGMNDPEAFASWRSRTLNLSYYPGCLLCQATGE